MFILKKHIKLSMLFIFMLATALHAAPLMSLAQPAIEPSPLDAVESNGEGNVTFLMREINDVEVPGINRFKLTIALGKVELKNGDTSLVKVLDSQNGDVDVTNKFDVTYLDAPDYTVRIQQKGTETLPAFMIYRAVVPVTVRVNTPITNPGNGFLVNMSSEGDAIADGDSSDYTYTLSNIDAVDDTGTVGSITGGTVVADVTTNDTLGGTPVTLGTDVSLTTVTDNTPLEVNLLTGEATVPANTQAGTYTETYTLCETLNPSNCDDANVTVTVTAAVIDAVDDMGTVLSTTGGVAVADVTNNDTLGGNAVTLGTDVNLTAVTDNTPLEVNLLTGEATVPANTPAGTYTETYTLCETLNPSNCDDANVTVTVTAAVIDAVDDTGTVLSSTGGVAVADVTSNDTLDANPVTLGTDVNLTAVTDNTPLEVNLLTGEATVPANTPAGTYTETYTLCETLNPSNCDDANVTVTVTAAVIDAVDDTGTVLSSTGGVAVADVTTNDTLDANPVTLGTDVNLTAVTDNTPLEVNLLTGEATVPANTPAGTYTETYTLCETLNPSNCDDANVTVTVTDDVAPSAPTVVITEDINNDGNISRKDELVGDVNVTITLPVDAEVNDTLTITNPDGTTTDVPVTQDMLDNGYHTSYPAPSDDTPVVVKATVTDEAGNTGPEASDSAVLIDILPTLTIVKQVVNDNGGTLTASAFTFEVDDAHTGGTTVLNMVSGVTQDVANVGTYHIFENDVAQYEFVNITCIDNNLTPVYVGDKTSPENYVDSANSRQHVAHFNMELNEDYTCYLANGDVQPSLPEITIIDGKDTEGVTPTNVDTNDTTPEINGTCEANLTVTVQIDGADIDPSTTCTAEGTFSLIPTVPLTEGEHNATVTQTGENNITSPISPIDTITIDTTAPSVPTVVITEDTNDDGNISRYTELNGTVDVNITLPVDAEVGDTLTVTNPDGSTTDVPVTQELLDNGYTTSYPEQVDPIIVKATVTDPAGNTSPEGMDEAVIVDDVPEPDYKPVLTVYGGIVYGEGVHDFSFDTLVLNVVADSPYDASNPLIIRIPKNSALNLSYDPSMTLFKGDDVENNLWSFDDTDSFDYVMTYLGTDIPTNRSRFAITGTFSVEEGEVGKFILETTIKSSTGGDSNIDNNSDRDTMQKKL
ncbi:MAG: Unknown protein [uncultured Sulfurovum sp.]|uniref:Bacterial Ig-like domain-containing protein n=1 Tax=uncultured Sulfurovum sp. TaxID=269237 RepID=A0A6S6SPZ6_9BACT|nr:MAG: Unknown protein [uncultured Sulfurovum sp.]